ncbi:MAG: hypothetical protein KH230_24115 [Enterocloster asparagiformis]|nr:hypothetical protein [Enterocloster asparagiformis]
MARESGGGKVNIGAASLVLIFIVLCLATFGLLSLSSAKGDLSLAERQAEAVSAYYEADAKGQEWVRQVDAVLQEEMGHSDDSSSASDAVKARLGDMYHQEEGVVVTDIPMERGQSLRIELTLVCGEGVRYQIHSWYVYDSGQYEIDNSMPVWDGGAGA